MSDRYGFDEEDGFFVDMAHPDDERPDLGIELLTSEVLELLNDTEFEKLVRYVRASKLEALMLTRSSRSTDGMKRWIKAKENKDEACQALGKETRKAIEDTS